MSFYFSGVFMYFQSCMSYEIQNTLKTALLLCKNSTKAVMRSGEVLIATSMVGGESKQILDGLGLDTKILNKIFKIRKPIIRTVKADTITDVTVDDRLINILSGLTDHASKKIDEVDLLGNLIYDSQYEINKYLGRGSIFESFKILLHKRELDERKFSSKNSDLITYISDCNEKKEFQSNWVYKASDSSSANYNHEFKIESCYDMTYKAFKGAYHDAIGRDDEIDQIEEILNKQIKKNAILIGEAGVGKTCIVEYLCNKIVRGEIPTLTGKRIIAFDLCSALAGTKYRGDLEQKMEKIMSYISNNPNIILFIDEIHYIYGSGNSEGNYRISDIFKPYISRGQISVIGATTFEDYRKNIEKDPALERRFDKVVVEEPTKSNVVEILMSIKPIYEEKYNLTISESMISYIVDLAEKYLAYRKFPDKAIDIFESAFSKSYIMYKKDKFNLKNKFTDMSVTIDVINEVISRMSRIPVSNLTSNDVECINNLPFRLSESIMGQQRAIDTISNAIKITKSNFGDHTRPLSFLFFGPTGVGKTELAKVLAENLFGSRNQIIRFDMSEYSEESSVNKLIGSAPGYVGYEDSGKLVKEVKNKPYSIILFDEIEKAHPSIFNVFLQILDDGILTNAKGQSVDLKNTIIIMTSNVGYSQNNSSSFGFNKNPQENNYEKLQKIGISQLEKVFRPEFLNRIGNIVLFNSLTPEDVEDIVENMMIDIVKLAINIDMYVEYDKEVISYIASSAFSQKYGARPLRRFIDENIKLKLANIRMCKGDPICVKIEVNDSNLDFCTYEQVEIKELETVES